METFAYIEAAIVHEDPAAPELRSLKELGLTVPSSAWVGLVGILLSVTMLAAQVPQSPALADQVLNRRVTITGSVVNVRNGPGTNYGLNGRPVYQGERLQVVRLSSNGWYQLADGGWFSSSFASTGSSGSAGGGGAPGSTPINRRVTITGSVVNVRNGPGTNYGLNGRPVYQGERLQVVRLSSNGWYQLADGGWFSSSFASTGSSGSAGGGGAPGSTPLNRRVTITGSVVNVRNGPGTNYGLNGRPVYQGERLQVVRLSSNGWYQLSDGGWFSSSFASSS